MFEAVLYKNYPLIQLHIHCIDIFFVCNINKINVFLIYYLGNILSNINNSNNYYPTQLNLRMYSQTQSHIIRSHLSIVTGAFEFSCQTKTL